jgi:GT2 family glycosyltransferase
VVLNPENNGFAYSSNVGIKLAMARGADYVWLLNPDTTVDADSLSELVEASIREPKVMAFGSKILYGQGTQPKESSSEDVIWSAGASINFSSKEIKMIGAHEVDRGQYDASHECDYLPGCSLLFKTELVEKVGLLPQDYFMYFEETHWCTKIKNHGGGLMYVPGSKVWHFAPDDKLQKPFTVYYYNRNELKYWYENVSLRGKLKILLDVVFRRLPRNLRAWYLAKTKEQKLLFYAHLSSSIDFLFGRFGRRVFLNR